MRFGYVDQGHKRSTRLLQQFNINTYAPTMLLFKENTEKPVDIIQVHPAQPSASVIKHSLPLYQDTLAKVFCSLKDEALMFIISV